jgi:phage terminase large subunit
MDEQTAEAAPSDVCFVNEGLDIDNMSFISGWLMRCKDLFILDWNPKFSDHWCYNLEKCPNCLFTHSTYKDNKHLEQTVINEIESYNPWHPDDANLPEVEHRPHPMNVENGTADKYRHEVYALGLRSSPEGLVFNDVTYIDQFPADCHYISYGMDFGEANETAITKNGLKIEGPKIELFTQKLFYLPTQTSQEIIDVCNALGIDQQIWYDNNKPGWINDIRSSGITALATRKFPGSREYWISTIKRCKIHIVRDPDFRKEQENFKYRVVDGIQLSETVKKYDHLWSSLGYSCVGDFRQYMNMDNC